MSYQTSFKEIQDEIKKYEQTQLKKFIDTLYIRHRDYAQLSWKLKVRTETTTELLQHATKSQCDDKGLIH